MQRYLFEETLDPEKPPEEKLVKTNIYGVKSSGNIAERGIRETARISKEKYPKVYDVIINDIYVDDCLSGARTKKLANGLANDMEHVMNTGGYSLKAIAESGKKPPESAIAFFSRETSRSHVIG